MFCCCCSILVVFVCIIVRFNFSAHFSLFIGHLFMGTLIKPYKCQYLACCHPYEKKQHHREKQRRKREYVMEESRVTAKQTFRTENRKQIAYVYIIIFVFNMPSYRCFVWMKTEWKKNKNGKTISFKIKYSNICMYFCPSDMGIFSCVVFVWNVLYIDIQNWRCDWLRMYRLVRFEHFKSRLDLKQSLNSVNGNRKFKTFQNGAEIQKNNNDNNNSNKMTHSENPHSLAYFTLALHFITQQISKWFTKCDYLKFWIENVLIWFDNFVAILYYDRFILLIQ